MLCRYPNYQFNYAELNCKVAREVKMVVSTIRQLETYVFFSFRCWLNGDIYRVSQLGISRQTENLIRIFVSGHSGSEALSELSTLKIKYFLRQPTKEAAD